MSSGRPVLITTDLDQTLIFSERASARLGGGRPHPPARRIEETGRDSDAQLCHAAARALSALPARVVLCVATSRDLARLGRLRLPFTARYAIAANGGIVLTDGVPDARWAARTARLLADAAPASQVRPVLAGTRTGAGIARPPWLLGTGEPDEMRCLAIVDRALLPAGELDAIAARCAELGWQASLTGRKLYAFPRGFGKEHAAAFVAERVEAETGVVPSRLAAGDSDHDLAMLAAAGRAWVPAGSELAFMLTRGHGDRAGRLADVIITNEPGHAAAAQITGDWLEFCSEPGLRDLVVN